MGERSDQLLLEVEFTYRWYRDFLERLWADDYEFLGFSEDSGDCSAFLRHDVDLSLEAALRMARLEAGLGISATYFVMLSSSLYNPFERTQRERIEEIESLGHDVGLHFSTHEYWDDRRPGADEIEDRVTSELSVLESILDDGPTAVSFHIPPDYVIGRSFDGFLNAYAPEYFEDAAYVADSKQRWRDQPPNVEAFPDTVQILTHPGLWNGEDADFTGRIEEAIVESCRHAQQSARGEFIDGVND